MDSRRGNPIFLIDFLNFLTANFIFLRANPVLLARGLDLPSERSTPVPFFIKRPTVSVTCVWARVDSAWEQEKLVAWKMLKNAAESHTSGADFAGRLLSYNYVSDIWRRKVFYRLISRPCQVNIFQ